MALDAKSSPQEQLLGSTLLEFAFNWGTQSDAMVAYLHEQKGVDPNSLYQLDLGIQTEGMRLIHFMAREGNSRAVRKLCGLGVKVDVTFKEDDNKKTPLLMTTDAKTAKALLIHKADANVRLKDRATPLILAARTNNVSLLEILLKAGDSDLKDAKGESPLIAALKANNREAVLTILEKRKKPGVLSASEEKDLTEVPVEMLFDSPAFLLQYFSNKRNKNMIDKFPHYVKNPAELADWQKITLPSKVIMRAIILKHRRGKEGEEFLHFLRDLISNPDIQDYIKPGNPLRESMDYYMLTTQKDLDNKRIKYIYPPRYWENQRILFHPAVGDDQTFGEINSANNTNEFSVRRN